MQRKLGAKGVALLVSSIGVLAVAGGLVYATIPDTSGLVHGCYAKSTGNLRVIDDSSSSCKSNEQSLTWNATGPQGPPGPAGPGGNGFATDSGFDPIPIAENTEVVGLTLPEGSYLLTGKVVVGDSSQTNVVVCELSNGGTGGGPSILDISQSPNLQASSVATLALVGSVELTQSATISIVCTAQNTTFNGFAQYAHLNAVQVAALQ
jgi:hypothetical protein